MRRSTLAAILAALFVVLGVRAGSADPREAGAERVRAVTFNVFHGGPASGFIGDGGHLERRLAMTVAQLRRLQPDVIALQEASIGRRRGNVASRIAGALGYYVAQAPASERVFARWFLGLPMGQLATTIINFNEGPAVVSRWPIVKHAVFDLPRCGGRLIDPRVLFWVEIESPFGPLSVYSTHTSGETCQIERIASVVQRRRSESPGLLMGDFNQTERFPALVQYTTHAGFTDVFRAANPEDTGYTDLQEPNATAPTVSRRYDYVFVVPGRRDGANVLGSRVVLNEPGRRDDGGSVWPSDHYGVLAELALHRR
jgi:endonuclease/exonuclease/phosphatase family metal-dependent hydrolase